MKLARENGLPCQVGLISNTGIIMATFAELQSEDGVLISVNRTPGDSTITLAMTEDDAEGMNHYPEHIVCTMDLKTAQRLLDALEHAIAENYDNAR